MTLLREHGILRHDISNGYIESEGVESMRSRGEALELALLGLLSQEPLHGYELRKRMKSVFGPFRALSFSVLYPQLRRMVESGFIRQEEGEKNGISKRTRLVYSITKEGAKKFSELTERETPSVWDDETFEVHVAFFSPTSKKSRIRILEGRLRRLQERAEILRIDLERSAVGLDKYLIEWRRHSLETAEREIAWLQSMINSERKTQ